MPLVPLGGQCVKSQRSPEQKLICQPRKVFLVPALSLLLRSAASSCGARMIQLVTLLCMEPISVPGRQTTEGGGKRTTPCHSSFKELFVAAWCPVDAAGKNWVCWQGGASEYVCKCEWVYLYFYRYILCFHVCLLRWSVICNVFTYHIAL